MKVTVKAGCWAKRYVGEETVTVNILENSTVADLISVLGLPADDIGLSTVDNKAVSREHILYDDDVLKFYPSIVGG